MTNLAPATTFGVSRLPLTGRVAVVTGGWSQIAAAVAARLRAEGAEVIAMHASESVADQIAVATGAVAFVGDPSSRCDVAAAAIYARERFGGLDAIIATAGETDHIATATIAMICDVSCPELAERCGAVVVVTTPGGAIAHAEIAGLARTCGVWGVRVNAVVHGEQCAAPGQVAAIVRFLATPEASLVDGCVLMADGGAHAREAASFTRLDA